MSDLLSAEDFLLASDNHLGALWAHHYIDGPYPESIQDWLGARQVFYSAYVLYREKQCQGEHRFRVPQGVSSYVQAAAANCSARRGKHRQRRVGQVKTGFS